MVAERAAKVTPIEEGRSSRSEADQGYFFKTPDWLASELGQHRATGAAWAIINLVGQRTRWGDHSPQRITQPEMVEQTHYAKQTVGDALACLIGWGLLYEEHDQDQRYRRYALVDRSSCNGVYEDSTDIHIIDLLEHPGYQVRATILESRMVEKKRNHPRKQDDIILDSRTQHPRKQDDIILDSRMIANDQPALEAVPATPLDYVDRIDKEDTTPNGVAALAGTANSSHSQTPTQQPALFPVVDTGKAAGKLPLPLSSKRAKKEPTPEEIAAAAQKAEERAAFEERKTHLTALWLEHPRTVKLDQMSPTEQRGFYSGMARLTHTTVTPEELPRLIDTQAGWSKGTYIPDPIKMEASLGTLRKEAARGPQQKGATYAVAQGSSQRDIGQRNTGGADPNSFLRPRSSHA
jgi:hypothetical protein